MILLGGVATYITRLSFIYLLGNLPMPDWFRRGLRFVPMAVLSAIVLPELAGRNGTIDISLRNPQLLAGKPLTAPELAHSLNIPLNRCQYLLQILCRLDLLEESSGYYTPSATAQEAILMCRIKTPGLFKRVKIETCAGMCVIWH